MKRLLIVGVLLGCVVTLAALSTPVGTTKAQNDYPPTPMACTGPIQEPGCPGYNPDGPSIEEPHTSYGDTVATAESNVPANVKPPITLNGLVSQADRQFKAYVKNALVAVWWKKDGVDTDYKKYFEFGYLGSNISGKNQILRQTKDASLVVYQLAGSEDKIYCQTKINGVTSPQDIFQCGQVAH